MYTMQISTRTGTAILFVCSLLIGGVNFRAQGTGAGTWKQMGPGGGIVDALLSVSGAHAALYAGTMGGGIFKKTDAGSTWVAMNSGIKDLRVTDLAVSPKREKRIYAGTLFGGLFLSDNGGFSWMPLGPLNVTEVDAVAVGASSPPGVIVEGRTKNGTDRLLISADGGASWQPPTVGPGWLYSIAASVSQHHVFYGGGDGFVWRSTDGGETWSTTSYQGPAVQAILCVDSSGQEAILAGCSQGGVQLSRDGGATWASSSGFPSDANIQCLAVNSNTQNVLLAGVSGPDGGLYRSSDGGVTWSPCTSPGDPDILSVAADPFGTGALYVGTGEFSLDGARGIDRWFYADGGGGLFETTDSGATWQPLNQGLHASFVQSLASTGGSSPILDAATLGGGLFQSIDGGGSWAPIGDGTLPRDIHSVVLDPRSTAVLYVGSGEFYESGDGGRNWRISDSGMGSKPDITAIAQVASSPEDLYAADDASGYLFRSEDGGQSWLATVPWPGLSAGYSQVATSSQDPLKVWTIINSALFKSEDGGLAWRTVGLPTGSPGVWCLAVAPSDDQTLYVGMNSWYCLCSRDGGSTWTALFSGPSTVSSIAVDPADPNTVYAASWGEGIFMTTDGGESWTSIGMGMESFFVQTLYIDPSGKVLYAATSGDGVWEIALHPGQVAATMLSSVSRGSAPFHLTLHGSGFQPDAKVYIGSMPAAWKLICVASKSKIVVKGGKALRAQFPPGTTL